MNTEATTRREIDAKKTQVGAQKYHHQSMSARAFLGSLNQNPINSSGLDSKENIPAKPVISHSREPKSAPAPGLNKSNPTSWDSLAEKNQVQKKVQVMNQDLKPQLDQVPGKDVVGRDSATSLSGQLLRPSSIGQQQTVIPDALRNSSHFQQIPAMNPSKAQDSFRTNAASANLNRVDDFGLAIKDHLAEERPDLNAHANKDTIDKSKTMSTKNSVHPSQTLNISEKIIGKAQLPDIVTKDSQITPQKEEDDDVNEDSVPDTDEEASAELLKRMRPAEIGEKLTSHILFNCVLCLIIERNCLLILITLLQSLSDVSL